MLRQCLICEKVLRDEDYIPRISCVDIVYEATIWRSTGNFGSTLFDPFGAGGKQELLEAYICDECLIAKGKLIYHLEGIVKRSEDVKVQTFFEKTNKHELETLNKEVI